MLTSADVMPGRSVPLTLISTVWFKGIFPGGLEEAAFYSVLNHFWQMWRSGIEVVPGIHKTLD